MSDFLPSTRQNEEPMAKNWADIASAAPQNIIPAPSDVSSRFNNLKAKPESLSKAKGGVIVQTDMKAPYLDSAKELDWLLIGTNHFPSAFAAMMAAEPFDHIDDETIDMLSDDPFEALRHRRSSLTAEKDLNRQTISVENAAEHRKKLVAHLREINEAKKARKDVTLELKAMKNLESDMELSEEKPKPKDLEVMAVGMDGFTVPNYIKENNGKYSDSNNEKQSPAAESPSAVANSSFGAKVKDNLLKAKESIVTLASTPFKNASFSGSQRTPLLNEKVGDSGLDTLNDVAKNLKREAKRADRGVPLFEAIDVFPLRSVQTFSVATVAKHFPNTKSRLFSQQQRWSAAEHVRPIRNSLAAIVKGDNKSGANLHFDANNDLPIDNKPLSLKKGSLLSFLPLPKRWEPSAAENNANVLSKSSELDKEHLLPLLEKGRFFASDAVHAELRGSIEYAKALFENILAFRAIVTAAMDANRHLIANHHRNLALLKKIETAKLRRTTSAANVIANCAAKDLKVKEESTERLIDRKMANYRRKQFLEKKREQIRAYNKFHSDIVKNNRRAAETRLKSMMEGAKSMYSKAQFRRNALIQNRLGRLQALEAIRKRRTEANIANRNKKFSPVEYW